MMIRLFDSQRKALMHAGAFIKQGRSVKVIKLKSGKWEIRVGAR